VEESGLPLANIKVLDLSHIVAGPHCAMLLADAGADVTKIEPPGGDFGRERGVVKRAADGSGVGAYFLAVNRGKRTITLDLKSESGSAALWQLIRESDVLIENFRKGTMDRLGFSYAEVQKQNPSLIYTSIRAFNDEDTGRSQRGGLAIVAEAESGLAGHCLDASGRPVWYGVPLGDLITGLTAYGAVTTALAGRKQNGCGRFLPISMVSSLLSMNVAAVVAYQINGAEGVQVAKDTAPYGFFRCNDGFLAIAITMDKFWALLCRVMNRPDLADDARYSRAPARNPRIREVSQIVEEWTRDRCVDDCLTVLSEVGIPCGRVNDTQDLLSSDEFQDAAYFVDVADGIGGVVRMPSNPMGFMRAENRVHRLNEDYDAVMREMQG
jgi:crotonobetainyl-CoA:carnitine CoA-transferase CaiB-like acyl-CoA transferase